MKNSIVVAVTVMLSGLSQGSILYQDAFNDGIVGNSLNNVLDVSTNGAVWKGAPANYIYTANNAVKVNTTALRTVFLEFAPSAGNIYTYSADVRVDARSDANTVPFGIGFISANNLVTDRALMNWFNNDNSPWISVDPQREPSEGGGYPNGVARSYADHTPGTVSGVESVGLFNNYKIVLDTTAANWSATYLVNDAQFFSYTYSSGNPTIGGFGFGSSGTTGNSILGEMDSVELSVIPEPATLGLMGCVSAGILCIRRFMLV